MRKEVSKQLLYLTLFGIAMGFLEAAVVYYIRQLYYPGGFNFPLKILPIDLLVVEWFRELATIVMLLAVAFIAARHRTQRFSIFLYLFGVWDIFYYIWLKVMLNWPVSFFTWDLLFMIPVTWIGPVLAPIILSLTMIIFALYVISREVPEKLHANEVYYMIIGSIFVIITFIWDYSMLIFRNASLAEIQALFSQHVPNYYSWPLFILGELFILYAMLNYYKRT